MEDLARQADALWRATVFVAVGQLHLADNPLILRPLTPSDVKAHPSGHWGTVPGTAWVLAHIALAAGMTKGELVPVIGPGHAGVVQLALAWLTGNLATVRPQFTTDVTGLTRLVRSFPHVDGLGAEVSPLLSAGGYLGGCLGGALAFAQGSALDAPGRVVMPIIGDGECETPTTTASWLATRELPNGAVLPIVQLNGFRMGAESVLGRMSGEEISAYATGLGWQPRVFHLSRGDLVEHACFHRLLVDAVHATSEAEPTAIFLRCAKGWSGPAVMNGRPLLGTAGLHKTPLTAPASDPAQFHQLREWLNSYRPHELFNHDGHPTGALRSALHTACFSDWEPDPHPPLPSSGVGHGRFSIFADAVRGVLQLHAEPGDFRLFSPDELASNQLGDLAGEDWVTELLAEEVLLGWLAGWTASGRRGLLISYEAFATLLTTGLVTHLKHRRLTARIWPSLNLLLTSYGWNNVYTHGDPSLVTSLLGIGDPAIRVLTPADPTRIAATLDEALRSNDRVNVVIAGKYPTVRAYASWLRLDICDPRSAVAVARTAHEHWAFTKWGLRGDVLADPADEAARLAGAVRQTADAAGVRIAFDALGTWDPALTLAFADQTDPVTVLWLEDPLPGSSLDRYREVTTSRIRLAVGERLLIDDDGATLIDAVQPVAFTVDVVGCGGLTRAIDLVSVASAAGVPVFPHGRSLVPAVHLAAALPDNVVAVEYQLQWEPARQRLYREPWSPMQGTIHLPSAPGLGVTPRSR